MRIAPHLPTSSEPNLRLDLAIVRAAPRGASVVRSSLRSRLLLRSFTLYARRGAWNQSSRGRSRGRKRFSRFSRPYNFASEKRLTALSSARSRDRPIVDFLEISFRDEYLRIFVKTRHNKIYSLIESRVFSACVRRGTTHGRFGRRRADSWGYGGGGGEDESRSRTRTRLLGHRWVLAARDGELFSIHLRNASSACANRMYQITLIRRDWTNCY